MDKRRLLLLAAASVLPAWGVTPARPLHIVFIPKSSDQVFWNLMRNGVNKAIQEEGNIRLTWRGPAHNDDIDAQIKILQLYTRPDVDAILITPTDRTRLEEPVRKAVALGIKVVVVDSALNGKHHSHVVMTDNVSAGKQAAKVMADLLNREGRVVVLRTVQGSASTDERAEGFVAFLKDNAPKMVIVQDVYGGGALDLSRQKAAELLKTHPGIDGIFAVNESSTMGMLRALRDLGLAGKPKFIGFDATDALIAALDSQEIHGLVVQNPYQMGYLGIKAAVAILQYAPVKDSTVYTGTTLVTRENVRSPEVQKLICDRC